MKQRGCTSSGLRTAAAVSVGTVGLMWHLGCATAAADEPSAPGDRHIPGERHVSGERHAASNRKGAAEPSRILRSTAVFTVSPAEHPSPRPAAATKALFLPHSALSITPRAAAARVSEPPPPTRPAAASSTGAPPYSGFSSAGVSPVVRAVEAVDEAVTQTFSAASNWLDGLPANAITDFLRATLSLAQDTWSLAYTAVRRLLDPGFGRVPHYDHVVVVMLENHSFEEIRGLADTALPPIPYINDTLVPGGALMTAAYGLQHPSQPNYYWLFAGNHLGITTDNPPFKDGVNTINSKGPNLYTELRGLCSPKTFTGYVEGYSGSTDLTAPNGTFSFDGTIASEGDTVGRLDNVVRHMPWAGFANVPQNVTADFASFGPDYSRLPDVAFIIPALQHDMHNFTFGAVNENSDIATSDIAMSNSDAWLRQNLNDYAQWALTHNSLLIITTDEDSTADWVTPPLTAKNYTGPIGRLAITPGAPGFTSSAQGPSSTAGNPCGTAQSGPNHIFVLFYGAHVVPGSYSDPITNVNVLRTIEAAMGIWTRAGSQPRFAGTTASGRHAPEYRFTNDAVTSMFASPV